MKERKRGEGGGRKKGGEKKMLNFVCGIRQNSNR